MCVPLKNEWGFWLLLQHWSVCKQCLLPCGGQEICVEIFIPPSRFLTRMTLEQGSMTLFFFLFSKEEQPPKNFSDKAMKPSLLNITTKIIWLPWKLKSKKVNEKIQRVVMCRINKLGARKGTLLILYFTYIRGKTTFSVQTINSLTKKGIWILKTFN